MLYSGSLDASPSVVSRDSPHDGSCAAYFAPRGDEGFPWPDLYGQVPVPCFPPTPFQSHQVFNPYLISGNSENNTSVSPHDAAVNPATITTAPHPISLDPRDLLREIVRPIVEEELSARLSMSSASTLSSPHSPYLSLGTPLRSDEFGRESWQNINQAVCDPFPTEVQSTDINQDTESLFHIALTPQTYTTDAITVLPDATPTIQLPHSPRTSGGPLVCGFQGCGKSFINREKLRAHKRCHNRKHLCPKSDCTSRCPRGFATKAELTRHLGYFGDEKWMVCEHCGRQIKGKSKFNLNRHIGAKHTTQLPHSNSLDH